MTRLDLRARLIAAIAVIVLLQPIVAFVVISAVRHELVEQIDDRLAIGSPERGASFDRERALERDHHHDDDADPARLEESPERYGETYEGWLSGDGELITVFSSNDAGVELPPPSVDLDRAAKSRGRPITVGATQGGFEYRLTASPSSTGGYLVTAIPFDEVDETMAKLTAVLAATASVVTGALLALTWWVLRLGIAPIKRMTASAQRIAAGDLAERVADTDPRTEAGQLGRALNAMLGQIAASLTERTKAEEKLRQFVADASHELRTPVATIRGYAELYRAGGLAEQHELDDAMRRTELESQRMSRLIVDLLDLARLDREPELTTTPVDLPAVVRDVVADASVRAPGRTITAAVLAPTIVVSGDEDLLRQVLANVVDNAIVHTDAPAQVTVTARLNDETAVIEVHDDGPGMTPEVVTKVTERFFRADPSRSRQKGGSGLGLAIAESILTAHGGTLEVESSLGNGTTVTLRIPVRTSTS